jgi:DNA-binding IclR family transcriptional regulator
MYQSPVRRTQGVESPRRILQLLLSLTEDNPHATIQELASRVGVPVSTAYRYVSLLRELGLVEEGDNATFHVGLGVMTLARAAGAANTMVEIARPIMRELSAAVDEMVMLMHAMGDNLTCVDQIEPTHAVRLSMKPGHLRPLHLGASGKTLLAYLPPLERTAYLDAHSAADPSLAQRRAELEAELDHIREVGYAATSAEIDEGIWAASAAIIGPSHRALASLSVAGPSYRIGPDRQRDILERLHSAAQRISRLHADQAERRMTRSS